MCPCFGSRCHYRSYECLVYSDLCLRAHRFVFKIYLTILLLFLNWFCTSLLGFKSLVISTTVFLLLHVCICFYSLFAATRFYRYYQCPYFVRRYIIVIFFFDIKLAVIFYFVFFVLVYLAFHLLLLVDTDEIL